MTDAAAALAAKTLGVRANERVEATLEIEVGMNDPMAVFLTLALVAVLASTATAAGVPPPAGQWASWARHR